ncbi:hypothetical protein ACUN9Y_20475 [Halomonas sp. V046]|uniref:hypothetical protein n=1 Tax=Halomonas sp. V046 TaxID=3459611 RepID=UPI004045001C
MRKRMRKCRRGLVVVTMALTLQGCTDDCNILERNSPWWCTVEFFAIAVVIVPYYYVSESIDDFWRDRATAKSEAAEREAILSGDVQAALNCLVECTEYYSLQDRYELKQLSAQRVIEWWSDSPEPEQLPLLMMAHSEIASQAWYGDDWPTAEDHYLRAAALAADPRIVEGALSERYLSGNRFRDGVVVDYDAQRIQRRLQVTNYHLRHGQEPALRIMDDCRPIGPWPSAWHANDDADAAAETMTEICRYAYKDVTGQLPPT